MQENPHVDMYMPKCGYKSITIKKRKSMSLAYDRSTMYIIKS